ncbi:type II CRISPR RNA-guided endonuclease Cas9 [Staphylococcus lutrae]|uniref:CRISPR-associated endonuclease Cas9 n=1 Tax=Staphylococcus lutrae TaxID=155085 RepID=A0AAC9RUA6_9STAP|nr:type II CRISPR RNA-guided endonuclease Cas9 [Staphylococcus lutrae]ARJ51065.1 type II CRISPR RNA-guided endonuclease Cas9 [Staphylococcus lutrae]PNZ38309.1 type II CRISPR RNA-guided endonuclease Cas9 [Staphylococcus lutrae]
MRNSYILGLDIGITSVGYGIIDRVTREVIDAGVRLFPEANVENNEGRRSKRGARRLKRRRIHRLNRIKQLLKNAGLLEGDVLPKSTNPYEIRVRGLRSPLTKDELVIALLHIAKRRGIHNINIVGDDEETDSTLSTTAQLKKNEKALKGQFVCELQLDRLANAHQVRGEKNRFKTEDIVKEVRALLQQQQNFHNIDNSFVEQYIALLESRRTYYEGPGEGSPYGWDGDIKKWYEMLMGYCTYFPEELRSVKYAYTADLFNALNDLNNLVITRDDNSKLTYAEKYHIIENVFKQKKVPTLKQIAKEIGVNESDIKGYRINKSEKPLFTSFKLYHDLKSVFSDPTKLEDIDLLDRIAVVLTMYQDAESMKAALNTFPEVFSEAEKEKLSALTGYAGTHRLSLKCMNLLIPDLWQTSLNQMELFVKLNLKPQKLDLSQCHQIPTQLVDEFILSPVVKRAFTQSIKVINAIIQKYGLPDDIIIELAREKNSADKRKFLNQLQKKNEKARHEINTLVAQYGQPNAKRLVEKITLHQQQEGKCLYSLKDIPLEQLLKQPYLYEVDHIIPRSVSFDNSMQNKVLVLAEENAKKGNQTPYQYLNSREASMTYPEFKQHILNLSKAKDRISKKKRNYLLEERDINKFDVQKDFINRNLVDTRYATRELASLLKAYFKTHELPVKVKTINGGFTHYLRKVWKFDKDRNKGYKHHAEDALIIANADFLFKNQTLNKIEAILNEPGREVESDTVKVQSEDNYQDLFENTKKAFAIKNFKDFKFSHRVDQKPNRQLVNDTLYSTREVNEDLYVVQTLKDIYSKDNKDVKRLFDKQPEKFLMFQHDPETFKKFELAMKQYAEEKNPLARYYEEQGYITKYAKKGDGPPVKSLKYIGKKVGKHLDVTGDYEDSNRKLVKLSLKSFRFDIYHTDKGYKMVPITYLDVQKKEKYYYIPTEKYEALKQEKGINQNAQFIGSFYYNDLIEFDGELYRVIGINNGDKNLVELDMVDIRYKEYCELNSITTTPRIVKTISPKTQSIEKYTTDILGNLYKAQPGKKPQFIFNKDED